MKEIESALNQGFNAVLYPEGRTGSGEMVQAFKKTPLASCARTGANLLPAVLNFKTVKWDQKMQDSMRDLVFWYGKIPVLRVVWNISAIRSCQVELKFLNAIEVNEGSERREVAHLAQTQVEKNYIKIPRPQEIIVPLYADQ